MKPAFQRGFKLLKALEKLANLLFQLRAEFHFL